MRMTEQCKSSSLFDLILEREYRFAQYFQAGRLIVEHPSITRCKAIRQMVGAGWYERYFRAQPNMMLVRNYSLPEGVLGMVLRRNTDWNDESRALFLVLVAPMADEVAEHFVIAHELGHILLHGRLMHAGMILVESDSMYGPEEDDRRHVAELEANIYALLSVIPTGAIEALEAVLERAASAAELGDALGRVTGHTLDPQLVKERLVLHHVLSGARSDREFYETILLENTSWTLHGAAGMLKASEPRKPGGGILSEKLYDEWRLRMREKDVLPVELSAGAHSHAAAGDAALACDVQ